MNFTESMMHRSMLLTAFFLMACCVSLGAEKSYISVRVLSLSKQKMPELYFATKEEQKLAPIHWSKRQPSVMVMALRDESLPLFKVEVGQDGEPATLVAQRVKIPAGAKEILLFGWLHEGELKVHAIGDNFLTAKYNDWMLINFSSKEIHFKIGEDAKPVNLASKEVKIYTIDIEEDKGAAIYGGANIRGQDRLFYSTFLPVRPNQRAIVFFVDDGDKIRTTSIADLFARRPKADADKQVDNP